MSNKLFNGNNTDYLVEGAKDKGYLKCGGSYKDGNTSNPVNGYDKSSYGDAGNWFEGKKGDKGYSTSV